MEEEEIMREVESLHLDILAGGVTAEHIRERIGKLIAADPSFRDRMKVANEVLDFFDRDPPSFIRDGNEVTRATAYARDMSFPPKSQSTGFVRNRGERLSKILWRGKTWAATTYGVERLDGLYHFNKERAWEDENKPWGGWVKHMSIKMRPGSPAGDDLMDFAEALRVCRLLNTDYRAELAKMVRRKDED